MWSKRLQADIDMEYVTTLLEDVWRRFGAPQTTDQSGPSFFCTISVNHEIGKRCEDLVGDLQHCHPFLRQSACVFALQETDHWKGE